MKKIISLLIFVVSIFVSGQKAMDKFNISKMEYVGSKKEQANLLMKFVKQYGIIDKKDVNFNEKFINVITNKIDISTKELKSYLTENNILESSIGGNIDLPISNILVNGNKVYAKYFVIHDMSSPEYQNEFPKDINDSSWKFNDPEFWNYSSEKRPAHILVTRTGESKTLVDFSTGWRATKFESKKLGAISRGLFLHVELLQPRVYPPGKKGGAMKAPTPGFTQKQYDKLALLYVAASVRKGEWLLPAFHVNIDNGLADGHDDPQNFDLKKFEDSVLLTVNSIKQK